MKTTDQQMKLLKFYAEHEMKPMTILHIARIFWLNWVLLSLAVIIGLWSIDSDWPGPGWLLIGMSIGMFSRDMHRIISLYRTRAVIHEIIKWDRLKELIRNHREDAV